jgi:pyridoxamine 5'-phosphate oxidase
MNKQDCIKFTNENPICYLATTENDQPHVRVLGFWFADDSGFYLQTGAIKEFYKQLKSNSKTEICFYKKEGLVGTMLRIEGEVEFLNDKQLKEKVMTDRPFLKGFGLSADSPGLIIFRIAHGKAHFWTMEDNLKPKDYITF